MQTDELNHPGVLSFLPILYVAWADAILTPSEIEIITNKIDSENWLINVEKQIIKKWLDPQNPPSPELMKAWLQQIKASSSNYSTSKKTTLAEAGVEMARIGANDDYTRCTSPEACKALYDVEQALGVLGSESYEEIIGVERPAEITIQPSFQPHELTTILDGDHADIINKIKTILADPKFKYVNELNKEDYREQVLQWCQYLADQGLGALGYPKEFDGGGDLGRYFTAMETLSYHDLSMVIKFGVQFGLFGMSIMFLGTKKHHSKYLSKAGSLELPGCFAMTETGHGSNVRDIETTATFDPKKGEFVIDTPNDNARKDYIGNAAAHGQMATVFAQLITHGKNFGVHAFLVPIRNKEGKTLQNIKIEDCGLKLGLNGVDNGRIWFDHIRIPAENMLDKFASVDKEGVYSSPISSDSRRFFTMLGTLVGGRIGIPRAGLSATKSALTFAIKYGVKRRQFGAAGQSETLLLDYRTHQRRLFPLISNTYALHFALQYLTNRFLKRTEEDAREIEALAAGLKAWATWNTTSTIQECREACGGKGYLAANRFAALKADTDIFTTFEGDNTVLMQLVAKSRLTDFKQEFHEINFFGIVKYIATQAAVSIFEKNPIATRRTDDEHLQDPEFHLSAFKYRERSILSSAARRLKHQLDSGTDSFEAFNNCQFHLVMLAHAYIELVILEQFQKGIESISNSDVKKVLTKVYNLFALTQMEKNKGWYLEADYFESSKTKAIRRMINQLCKELRPDIVGLVDAYNIPEQCLGAEIVTS
ncbi:MAG: acyl-CoA dehydrogenase [Cyclobacteriaceae bacterium]